MINIILLETQLSLTKDIPHKANLGTLHWWKENINFTNIQRVYKSLPCWVIYRYRSSFDLNLEMKSSGIRFLGPFDSSTIVIFALKLDRLFNYNLKHIDREFLKRLYSIS